MGQDLFIFQSMLCVCFFLNGEMTDRNSPQRKRQLDFIFDGCIVQGVAEHC